jgi:hypothetical protein
MARIDVNRSVEIAWVETALALTSWTASLQSLAAETIKVNRRPYAAPTGL